MKKIIITLGFMCLFAAFNLSCVYAESISVNGRQIDTGYIVISSRTLVPVRGVFEELNFDVSWDSLSRTATLSNRFSKETVVISADESTFTINGSLVAPDVSQTIIGGSLFIPLRAISEGIGAEVKWNADDKSISISRGDNITFADEGMEALVKHLAGKSELSVSDLYSIKTIDSAEGFTIKCLDDMIMLNSVDNLRLSGEPVTDFSPVIDSLKYNISYSYAEGKEDELFSFGVIDIRGCDKLDLKTLEGIDTISLYADDYQIDKIENVKVNCLYVSNSGRNVKVVLGDIFNRFPELFVLDVSESKPADVDNVVLFKDFSYIALPYNYTLGSNMDFDKYAGQYIVFYNKIQEIASALKASCSTPEETIKAAHDYIINNARYDVEAFDSGNIPMEDYTAYGVLVNGKGICQSYAEAFKIIMDEVGIECYVMTGEACGGGEWIGHAWNIVRAGDKLRHIDLTYDDPIYYVNGVLTDIIIYDYYLLTDAEIEKDHKWAAGSYLSCS